MVVPSFFGGVTLRYIASLSGLPPQPSAVPMRWRTGSTSSFVPNAPLKSGIVAPSTSNASRTFFWLAGSQFGISRLPGPPAGSR